MKNLTINGELKAIPDEINTVSELLEYLSIPEGGTAIAVNNQIVRASNRPTAMVKSGDRITIITAAYGG